MFVERIIADSYDDASKLEKLAEKRISSFTQDKIVRRLLLDKMYYAELGQLRYMVEDPHDPQLLWFNA